jgi:tRNA G18 (ribose-2'-O)-methylase SpoU
MPLEKPIDLPPEVVRHILAPLRNDFSVAVVCPGNAFAVGAIVRIAHNFLAREVIVVGEGTWYTKASMGMHKYETIVQLPNVDELFRTVRGRPLWAIEKDEARQTVQAVKAFPPGVVLAFGSERFGLPKEIVQRADAVIGIPTYGVNHSLPVAVAAAIVMHEWARRKYVDGAVV